MREIKFRAWDIEAEEYLPISDGVCWAILGLLFIAMTTVASIYSKNMEIKHKENMAQLGICEEKGEDNE